MFFDQAVEEFLKLACVYLLQMDGAKLINGAFYRALIKLYDEPPAGIGIGRNDLSDNNKLRFSDIMSSISCNDLHV